MALVLWLGIVWLLQVIALHGPSRPIRALKGIPPRTQPTPTARPTVRVRS